MKFPSSLIAQFRSSVTQTFIVETGLVLETELHCDSTSRTIESHVEICWTGRGNKGHIALLCIDQKSSMHCIFQTTNRVVLLMSTPHEH